MKILHLSDTPLSGAPTRLAKLLDKHSGHESRHISWQKSVFGRVMPVDMAGEEMTLEHLRFRIYEWADIIHYHNRWKRQEVFQKLGSEPPKKPSVIQIHSPRNEPESFEEEAKSGLPIAVIAQYHVRQWSELTYIVPNVVDITELVPKERAPTRIPIVSFAPSNCNLKGWNNKGYHEVAKVLKPWKIQGKIQFQLIVGKTYNEMIALKPKAHVGIDELMTGSYHLSSLEYLALGVPCMANLDTQCEKVIKDLTGATELPWLKASADTFAEHLEHIIHTASWKQSGWGSPEREWMEKYWNPQVLCNKYLDMYGRLSC